MIDKFHPYKSRQPRSIIQAALVIALIVSPALIKSHFEDRARTATVAEYHSARGEVFSRIGTAIANRDLSTLLGIHAKYADSVRDPEFKSLIESGIATLTAREAEVELAVSKHLDLARHKEEASIRGNPMRDQLAHEETRPMERLSQLPR
ncbi:MAG: hypothetical protein V4584_10045 [Verrucomicrobiota bacterium]